MSTNNGVACEAATGKGSQRSLPSPASETPSPIFPNNANVAWRRSVLLAIMGGISFLAWPRLRGGLVRTRPFRPRIAGLGAGHTRTKMALYGTAAAPRPWRLFRNYYAVARIPENRGASTYETLWPGYKLYRWAGKTREFDGVPPPAGRAVCFVHVGKTAGSTVGCALGFRLHCNHTRHLPGELPAAATNMFHGDVYDCPRTSDFYLFVMRDPLARLRSAFVYGRTVENRGKKAMAQRSSKLFSECPFSSIDELASSGLTESGDASDECKQRARDMVRGNELLVFHTYYNYQYHLEMIPHDPNILVIRNEHLEEDWINVERMLGGTPEKNLTFAHANSRPKEARDLILGDRERRLLCHELCVEIQYYKMLLRMALNINKTQYQTSMKELEASCPHEASLKQCDFHTPNIEAKLIKGRGHRRNETGR